MKQPFPRLQNAREKARIIRASSLLPASFSELIHGLPFIILECSIGKTSKPANGAKFKHWHLGFYSFLLGFFVVCCFFGWFFFCVS